jgi:hypothetical protein
MKRRILITATALSLVLTSLEAQVVVVDPAAIAQSKADHIVDLAKYIEMVNNQLRQITTMTQELQQVTAYVKAFGDPSKLLNIVGANQLISGLQQSGVGQTLAALRQTASGIQSLQNNANGLYQQITNTSFSGISVPRAVDSYKPFSALENTSSNYTSVYDDAMRRREDLKRQMSATVAQLQASTTDAETQKLHGVLTGQTAQLHAVDQEIVNATSQSVVQDISNRNDEEKQQQARDEEIAADRHDALTKFGAMMVPDTRSDLRFGRSSGR